MVFDCVVFLPQARKDILKCPAVLLPAAQQQEVARRGMAGGDSITVHVEWLARRLKQQQEEAAATEQPPSAYRVSRVPGHVRLLNPSAFTAGLDGEARLRAGNRLKMAYLHSLISRGHPRGRAMYAAADVDGIGAEDFVHMLVLDGCFLIEHLVNVFTGKEEPSLHTMPFGPAQLSVDVVLAENQIPFFVLLDLIGSTRLPELELDSTAAYKPDLLMKLAPGKKISTKFRRNFRNIALALYYLGGEKGRDMMSGHYALPPAEGVCHILHLLRQMVAAARTRWEPPPRIQDDVATREMMQEAARLLLRRLPLLLLVPLLYPILSKERRRRASYDREDLPSASDLKRMWVSFKKARGGGGKNAAAGIASLLGPVPLAVKLAHEDRLRLPQLRIEFRTAPLLLNLMAFEQQEQQRAGDVSAYVWLMAKLVQSEKDARVLVAAEVVKSGASASDNQEHVVRFFRQVGGAASEAPAEMDKTYLGETLRKLRERSQHPLFMMWADIQRSLSFSPSAAVIAEFVTLWGPLGNFAQSATSCSRQKRGCLPEDVCREPGHGSRQRQASLPAPWAHLAEQSRSGMEACLPGRVWIDPGGFPATAETADSPNSAKIPKSPMATP
ncbi:hypothetical protein HU200_053728 [Digitaria exilis]|uniref:Uncharacterized protein n=1 Tax=Digitaria exilis TaxID=1010633 RepID=A0A835E896_9POAL|nr:hypothetical protein HU200_053728 [Digitaria exilis]